MNALQVTSLKVAYGKAVVLDGISFAVGDGELVALVGPNGAGKTSCLRALSRLIPSEGDVTVAGEPLPATPVAAVKAGLIHCPERRRLFPDLTVRDNMILGAHRRAKDPEVGQDMDWCLSLFPRLAERLDQYAGTMSGGEQQQLAIARSLMGRPKVLLLDEPSLGLASIVKEAIVDSVLTMRQRGISTLLVEQDVTFAFRCADRALVLEHGSIVKEGSPEDLENDPAIREAYLGIA